MSPTLGVERASSAASAQTSPRAGHALDFALLGEQVIGRRHLAAQRIAVGLTPSTVDSALRFAAPTRRTGRPRLRRAQPESTASSAPAVRDRLRRAQAQVGGQHFVGLPRNGLADAIGQEADRGQRADGEATAASSTSTSPERSSRPKLRSAKRSAFTQRPACR